MDKQSPNLEQLTPNLETSGDTLMAEFSDPNPALCPSSIIATDVTCATSSPAKSASAATSAENVTAQNDNNTANVLVDVSSKLEGKDPDPDHQVETPKKLNVSDFFCSTKTSSSASDLNTMATSAATPSAAAASSSSIEDMEACAFPKSPSSSSATNSSQTMDRPLEWKYSMRREMQEIIPGLYLGPLAAALPKNLDALNAAGITHIVCIRHESEGSFVKPKMPDLFNYWVLNIEDSVAEPIIPLFDEFYSYIKEKIENKQPVLVHSNTGMSRSAALVISFLMRDSNLSAEEATKLVQKRRFCIFPNEGFRVQLIEYEPILKAKMENAHEHGSEEPGILKRKNEDS